MPTESVSVTEFRNSINTIRNNLNTKFCEPENNAINEKRWRPSYINQQFKSLQIQHLFDRYLERISQGYFSQFLLLQALLFSMHSLVLIISSQLHTPLLIVDIILYSIIIIYSLIAFILVHKYSNENPKILKYLSIISFILILFVNIFVPVLHSIKQNEGYYRPAYTPDLIISSYVFLNFHHNIIAVAFGLIVTFLQITTVIFTTYNKSDKFWQRTISDVLFLTSINLLGLYYLFMNLIVKKRSFLDRRAYVESNLLLKFEKNQEEELMSSIIPEYIIDKVRNDLMLYWNQIEESKEKPRHRPFENPYVEIHHNVTILFADIVNYTQMTTHLTINELLDTLNELFGRFDETSNELGVLRIKFLGDCYYCVAGLPPNPDPNHADACVNLGLKMISIIADIRRQRNVNINMRIGIHSGTIISGIIGSIKWQYDIWSNDVDIANRMETEGKPGKVHITNTTKSLLKNKSFHMVETNIKFEKNKIKTFLISPFEDNILQQRRSTLFKKHIINLTTSISTISPTEFEFPSIDSALTTITSETELRESPPSVPDITSIDTELTITTTTTTVETEVQPTLFSTESKVLSTIPSDRSSETEEDTKLELSLTLKPKTESEFVIPLTLGTTTTTTTTTIAPGPTTTATAAEATTTDDTNNDTNDDTNDDINDNNDNLWSVTSPSTRDTNITGTTGSLMQPKRSLYYRLSQDQRRSTINSKRRTAFMNNNIRKYEERLHQTNIELQRTIEKLPLSKYQQWYKEIYMNPITLIFKNLQTESSFIKTPDPLFKYNLLAVTVLLVMIFVIQNLTLEQWEWDLWVFYTFTGIVLLLLYPLNWTHFIWKNHISKNEYETPKNHLLKFIYNKSISMSDVFLVRLIIYLCVCIIFTFTIFNNFVDCENFKRFHIKKKLVVLMLFDDRQEKNCIIPWHMTQICSIAIFTSFIFIRMYVWIKFTCAIIITALYSYCIIHFSDEYYKQSETFNYSIKSQTSHIMGIIFLTLVLHFVDRQTEYINRLDHFWYESLMKEQKQASSLHIINNMLLKNLLPVHVAEIYLDINRKHLNGGDLYHEQYEKVAVMFASIVNYSLDDLGSNFLNIMNLIICAFDTLSVGNTFGGHIEKIKIAKWTYMAACGLMSELGTTENETINNPTIHPVICLTRFAAALIKKLHEINCELKMEYSVNKFQLRIGIDYGGPVVAGVVGSKKPHFDIWGDSVNMASRMDTLGHPNSIQVLEPTANIISDYGYACDYRGLVDVKGKQLLPTYFVNLDNNFDLITVEEYY